MNFKNNNNPKLVLKVSQLIKQIQLMLEASYREVWVEAELSNLSKPASGHWYFSLKDENTQIRCAMFRNRASISRYLPKEGDLVRIRGKVTVYPARGDMQLIVEHIEPAGEGELQRQFEKLKLKLQQEGIFSQTNKQTIPSLPSCIGIITSPSGAAIQDVLSTLNRRFPSVNVIIYPAIVQGNEAAVSIISALDAAEINNQCDVILLTRGGGSLEDLWCFNDEQLVRKIYAIQTPIISAVGHEVDITLSDFVADLRAPTPTAAAELVTPDKNDINEQLAKTKTQLIRAQRQKTMALAQNIDWVAKRLKHPSSTITVHSQRLKELDQRLRNAIARQSNSLQTQFDHLHIRLKQLSPHKLIQQKQKQLSDLNKQAINSVFRNINNNTQKLKHIQIQLETLSHHRTLDRGYAMILSSSETVISSVKQLEENVNIVLSDGSAKANINLIEQK